MTYFGETPTIDGLYTVVRFLQTGEFATPVGITEAEVLVVGGGGAGGTWCGGGGGAGGVKWAAAESLSGTLTITVGAGAPRATANGVGANGGGSAFGGTGIDAVPVLTSNTSNGTA